MLDLRDLLEKAKEDEYAWNFMLARVLEMVGKEDEIQKLKMPHADAGQK